jgi:YesN/AraC family two-component response regulator
MTVNSIADDTNMSAVYLSRIFKEYTSESILDYMNRVKLEKAKELLTESSYTVNDISGKVGFINPKYFYTFFKKKTGVTPNEYRSCIKRQAY